MNSSSAAPLNPGEKFQFALSLGNTMCGQKDLGQQNKGNSLCPLRDGHFGDARGVLPLPEEGVGSSQDPAGHAPALLLLF